MIKFVTHPKKLRFINVEQIVAVAVRPKGYDTTKERCNELLFIEDEESNPDWRELTQEEKAELETFRSCMIEFDMANGKIIRWEFETKEDALLWIVQNLSIKRQHILKDLK